MKYVIYSANTEKGHIINMTHNPEVDFTYLKENCGLLSLAVLTPPLNPSYGAYILKAMNREADPLKRILFRGRSDSDSEYRGIYRVALELGVKPLRRRKHIYDGIELPKREQAEEVLSMIRGRIMGTFEGLDLFKDKGIEEDSLLNILQYLYLWGKISMYPSLSLVIPGKILRCEECGANISWEEPDRGIRCSSCGRLKYFHELLFACPEGNSLKPRHVKYKGFKGLTPYQEVASMELCSLLEDERDRCLLWSIPGTEDMNILSRVIRKTLARGGRAAVALRCPHLCRKYLEIVKNTFPSLRSMLHGEMKKLSEADLLVCSFEDIGSYYRSFDLIVLAELDALEKNNWDLLNFRVKRALREKGKSIYATSAPDSGMYSLALRGEIKRVTVPLRSHGRPSPEPRTITCRGLSFDNIFIPKEMEGFIVWALSRGERTRIIVPEESLVRPVEERLLSSGAVMKEWIEGDKPLVHITDSLEKKDYFEENVIVFFSDFREVFDERTLLFAAGLSGRGNTKGEVIFVGARESEEMDDAREMLRFMNKSAWEKEYLS